MVYDVVVIGGGLGGLECGSILSHLGMSVLVLEQDAQPGGCLQSYRRKGQCYDTGFHYVGGLDEGQSLHAVFDYLGLLNLPWRRLDPEAFNLVTIDGQTFPFAQGYDRFVSRLADFFPSERNALQRFADLLRQVAEQQFDTLLNKESTALIITPLMESNAWQYLNETFHTPLLIDVLSGTSLKMELRRQTLPLFTFLHTLGGFVESSWRLQGDASLIYNRLVDNIRSCGGDVMCSKKVTELVERCGRIVAVRCADGTDYKGKTFISDIHPAQTCDLVKESERMKKVYRRRMAQQDNTFGMFTVSLRLDNDSVPYFNHNHYVYRHPDIWTVHETCPETVDGLMVSCSVPKDGVKYTPQVDLLTPTLWEKWRQWKETSVGRRGEAYKDAKRQLADRCIALATTVVPQLANATVAATSTPLTWRDYTGTPEGSSYGIRKDCNNPLGTMLSPRTPIPNLFLTGQNLMVHGLHGVTATAFITCAEIVGRDAIVEII